MKRFRKENSGSNEYKTITDLLNSVRKNNLIDNLISEFNLEENSTQIINIEYFNYLLASIKQINKDYEKKDILIKREKVKCIDVLDDKSAKFMIEDLSEDDVPFFGKKDILISSKRSVKKDYLDKFYSANKFISHLKSKNKDEFIKETLEKLENDKSQKEDDLFLRIIRKIDEKESYIRAIASNRYTDYNLDYSIILLYILLNELNKKLKIDFVIEEIQIDDSSIVVSISSSEQVKLKSGEFLTFSIEMVNDEIKRSACKFHSIMHIKSPKFTLSIKPPVTSDKKSTFLSISHRNSLKNGFEYINQAVEDIAIAIEFILSKAKQIDMIKEPNEIKKYILSESINKRKNSLSENERDEIKKVLNKQPATSITDLFEMLGKIDLFFRDEEIQSREYWRSLIYNAIVNKGK